MFDCKFKISGRVTLIFRAIVVIIVSIIMISNFNGALSIEYNSYNEDNINKEINDIQVAILSIEGLYGSDLFEFMDSLNDYQWAAGKKTYRFKLTELFDQDIINGELNTKNYDLIIFPGLVSANWISMHYYLYNPLNIKNIIWKNNVADFIKNGGGFIGHCAGCGLITELDKSPVSRLEKAYQQSSLGISCVKSYYKNIGVPLLCQLQGLPPEAVGESAYVMCTGWNESNPEHWFGGAPLDVVINRDNPIFNDFLESNRRIRWGAGMALSLPSFPNREIKVLANYPQEEISDNESIKIYSWKYTGRLQGLISGFLKNIKQGLSLLDSIYFSLFKASDWICTNKIIETDFSNKPCMVMEIYPNKNKGRMILSGLHPEAKVWWGGHIEEKDDFQENCLYDALYHWVDIKPFEETKEDEVSYNWWIVRREVAWVAKIPDDELPPVYGPSQVSNIHTYNQPSRFIIKGIVEPADGNILLDLYYRYSNDNTSWSEWKYYGTSMTGSSWEFYSSLVNGPGYYEFYSIRQVEYEYYKEIETPPIGPDAIAYIYE